MNRFIVHPFVWHDDIRTNHAIVFTQPRSILPVRCLLWANGTHYIELRQHGIVTASWNLLAATHLQRVMRRDLVNDSCAVQILGR
jgi:hypothetical protein